MAKQSTAKERLKMRLIKGAEMFGTYISKGVITPKDNRELSQAEKLAQVKKSRKGR